MNGSTISGEERDFEGLEAVEGGCSGAVRRGRERRRTASVMVFWKGPP